MKSSRRKLVLRGLFPCVLSILPLAGAFLLLGWRGSRDFLQAESDFYQADPVAGHVHQPHAIRVYPWPEHPQGQIVCKTNNLGFREDRHTQVQATRGVSRILVTGDSHTDGVVNNPESFPHLLESHLNSRAKSTTWEVLNAGVGYSTFQNYVGCLRNSLVLKPRYFIVTIYTGNDFLEAVAFAGKRGDLPLQRTPFWERLKLRRGPIAMVSQGLNQAVYFKSYPALKETALSIAQQQLGLIRELCLKEGITLYVVCLPTKMQVENPAAFQTEKFRLGLTDAEADVAQEFKAALLPWLEQNGVRSLDLTGPMEGSHETMFWEQDYHLSTQGHALVAETLFQKLDFQAN